MDKVLKRLDKEATDNLVPADYFYTQPLPNDRYEWHFTILGQEETAFANGVYHGYFKLPKDYPLSPPDVYFLTPNGRFHTGAKICLNITGYHKEAWTPAWSLRTMVQAINAYMLVNEHGIGAIFDPDEKRAQYAVQSRAFVCKQCGPTTDVEAIIHKHKNKGAVGQPAVAEEKGKENQKVEEKGEAKTAKGKKDGKLEKRNDVEAKKEEPKKGRAKRVKTN